MTIDEYLDGLAPEVRATVEEVLACFREALPGAEERVRYGMPAVMLDGRYALHVGGWRRHAGVYPVAPLPPELEAQVAPYRAAKDALHFRHGTPVPRELVVAVAAELRRQRLAAG